MQKRVNRHHYAPAATSAHHHRLLRLDAQEVEQARQSITEGHERSDEENEGYVGQEGSTKDRDYVDVLHEVAEGGSRGGREVEALQEVVP